MAETSSASSSAFGGAGIKCHTSGALNSEVFPGLAQETSVFSHIGGRKAQEDRFCICAKLDPALEQASFYGVFDGTVGDFASDNVKDLIVPCL